VSACLVLAPYDDDPEPHPELVRVQRPGTALFMAAALCIGVFPESSYLSGEARVSLA
jgi:hypothetical protein